MFDIAFGGYLTHAVLRAREALAGRSHVDLAEAQSEQLASDLRKEFGLGYVRKDSEKGIKIKRPGFGGAHFELRYYVKGGEEALLPFAQSMALPRTRKLIAASAGAGAAMPPQPPHAPHAPHPHPAHPQSPAQAPPMPQHVHPGYQTPAHGVAGAPMAGGMGTSFAGSMYGPGAGGSQAMHPAQAGAGGGAPMGGEFGIPGAAGMGYGIGGGFGGGVGVQAPPVQAPAHTQQQAETKVNEIDPILEPLMMEMMRSRFMPRVDIGALVALTDGSPADATGLTVFIEEYLRSLNKDIEQANAQLGEALRQMCDGVCRQARAAVEMTKDKEAGLQAAGFEIE